MTFGAIRADRLPIVGRSTPVQLERATATTTCVLCIRHPERDRLSDFTMGGKSRIKGCSVGRVEYVLASYYYICKTTSSFSSSSSSSCADHHHIHTTSHESRTYGRRCGDPSASSSFGPCCRRCSELCKYHYIHIQDHQRIITMAAPRLTESSVLKSRCPAWRQCVPAFHRRIQRLHGRILDSPGHLRYPELHRPPHLP